VYGKKVNKIISDFMIKIIKIEDLLEEVRKVGQEDTREK